MKLEPLEEFGREFVSEVHDGSLAVMAAELEGSLNNPAATSLSARYRSLTPEAQEIVLDAVSAAVDQTFARSLGYFEDKESPVYYTTREGEVVDVNLQSDGLSAEPYGSTGWIERFSQYPDGLSHPTG